MCLRGNPYHPQFSRMLRNPSPRKSEKAAREIPFENRVQSRSQFLLRAPEVVEVMSSQPARTFHKNLDSPESWVTLGDSPILVISYPPEKLILDASGSKSFGVPIWLNKIGKLAFGNSKNTLFELILM